MWRRQTLRDPRRAAPAVSASPRTPPPPPKALSPSVRVYGSQDARLDAVDLLPPRVPALAAALGEALHVGGRAARSQQLPHTRVERLLGRGAEGFGWGWQSTHGACGVRCMERAARTRGSSLPATACGGRDWATHIALHVLVDLRGRLRSQAAACRAPARGAKAIAALRSAWRTRPLCVGSSPTLPPCPAPARHMNAYLLSDRIERPLSDKPVANGVLQLLCMAFGVRCLPVCRHCLHVQLYRPSNSISCNRQLVRRISQACSQANL